MLTSNRSPRSTRGRASARGCPRLADHAHVELLGTVVAAEAGDDGDGQHDEQGHAGGDQERPLAGALEQLPADDEGDGPSARQSVGAHACTTSRKSSDRVGDWGVNASTRPAARAASSTAWVSAPSASCSTTASPSWVDHGHAGQPVDPPVACACACDLDPQVASAVAPAQLGDAPVGDDLAPVEDGDGVAQLLHQLQLVAGEHDRRSPVGLLPQDGGQHVDPHRVEAGEGLVEHQQVGPVDEGRRQLHPLLVAEGQVVDLVPGPVGHAQPLDPLGRGRLGVGRLHPRQPAEELELVGHPHLGIEAPLLGHVADPAAGDVVDGRPVELDVAAVGLGQAEDDAHGGGLARPVAPDQAPHLALRTVKEMPSRATTSP